MTIGVKKVARPREMSFPESLYLVEIVKGLGVTMGHLLSNIVRQEGIKTIEYPEVRRGGPPRVRWTVPRFRYDQVMRLGGKVMLPLSLLNIFVTGLTLLLLNK